MDDLIKLLMELANRKPKPKGGGITESSKGVEFIGRKLTKEEAGDYALINSKMTDASRFVPFSIRNVGRDKRYMYIKDFADDFEKKFEQVITFLKDNPDIRLSQGQKDNILYNLGVYRRTVAEKNKLEKGIIEQGKKPEDIYKASDEDRPIEEMSFQGALEKIMKTIDEFKSKVKETEDIFSTEVSPQRQDRIKRLYYGKAYGSNSAEARGLGSFNLPKLHEAGIIKLDDTIYKNLKQGAHHYGGALTNSPDPVRIWRKHFGEDIFEKMKNWDYQNNESVFDWLKRNNIQPILKEGPKSATDYLHPVELRQYLDDELEVFNAYKNPKAESSKDYFMIDDPAQQMDRIQFHGENIRFLEDSLQRLDPDSFREYARTKTQVENPTVIPFKQGEGLESLTVLSGDDATNMLGKFLEKADQVSGDNVKSLVEGQTKKLDELPMRLIKNFNTEFRLKDLLNEGYSKEQAEVLIKAKNILKSGEELNPNEALLRVKEEMADELGIDVDDVDFDFQIEEPEPIDEFAKGGRVGLRIGSGEGKDVSGREYDRPGPDRPGPDRPGPDRPSRGESLHGGKTVRTALKNIKGPPSFYENNTGINSLVDVTTKPQLDNFAKNLLLNKITSGIGGALKISEPIGQLLAVGKLVRDVYGRIVNPELVGYEEER